MRVIEVRIRKHRTSRPAEVVQVFTVRRIAWRLRVIIATARLLGFGVAMVDPVKPVAKPLPVAPLFEEPTIGHNPRTAD